MINSTYTVAGGTVIDLHYLVSIVPMKGTCYVELYYQLLPKPVKIEIGNSSGRFKKDEYELELASIVGAWKIYKRNQNR